MIREPRPCIFFLSPLMPRPGDPAWGPGVPPDLGAPAAQAENIRWAEWRCREIVVAGGVGFAPHSYFTRFLDDEVASERSLGIDCGLALMARFDRVWAMLPPWRAELSSGMHGEIATARKLGKPVAVLTAETWPVALRALREGGALP